MVKDFDHIPTVQRRCIIAVAAPIAIVWSTSSVLCFGVVDIFKELRLRLGEEVEAIKNEW